MTTSNSRRFIVILEMAQDDVKKAKRYLQDDELTQAERCILHNYFLLRDNDLLEMEQGLKRLSPQQDPIVESQRQLLLGRCYNNQGHLKQAISHLEAAIGLLQGMDLHRQLFSAYHNLFIVHLNLKATATLKLIYEKMKSLKTVARTDELSLIKCKFCYEAMIGDEARAEVTLKTLEAHLSEMSDCQGISVLLDIFDYHVKLEDFESAQASLLRMKDYRKFNLTENFKFMKILLLHLTTGKAIYFTDADFATIPPLLHQIKCIQRLEQGNPEGAREHWKELAALAPNVYLDEFHYVGDKCLFSLCLERHVGKKFSLGELEEVTAESKPDLLFSLLQRANAPVPKEALYQLVYGSEYEEKSDFQKLQKLASRTRAKHGVEVVFKQGCYSLKSKKTA